MLLRLYTINFTADMVLQSSPDAGFLVRSIKNNCGMDFNLGSVDETGTQITLKLHTLMHFAHLKRLNISAPCSWAPSVSVIDPEGP